MKTYDLFPFPVVSASYPEHSELKQKIVSIFNDADFFENSVTKNLFHYKNDKDNSILYDEVFTKFREWCEKICYNYVTELMGYELEDKIIVTDSWLNKCNKGGSQHPHYHTNSYISGTYYVNFEQGHSPLVFLRETTSTHSMKPTISLGRGKTASRYNCDVPIYPQESELYLWQSQLTHGVPDNQLDNRISISMNFMPTWMTNQRYGYKVYYQ